MKLFSVILILSLAFVIALPAQQAQRNASFDKLNVRSTATFTNINNVIMVDGTTYPFTNAGIQAAVNAAPDGGEVDLGPGTYLLTGTGTEEILITKKLNFICSGWNSVLQVGASVPGTTDIIHIKPSALVQGVRIQDCYITPASGTPGRHGISIDGTTAALSNMVIAHNRIDALGGKSIAVINATGQATGTPYTTTIADNVTQGGIDLTNSGDTLNILNNTMTGSGGIVLFPVGATVQPASNGGAHGFLFQGNNVTNIGGIIVNNGWQGVIAYNNIEVANLAEANAACVDLDGNSAGNVENFKIVGNFIGCANGASSVDQIRFNRVTAAIAERNFVARSVGVAYRVTANANATQISLNRQAPTGETIATWLSDSGTKTVVDYIDAVTLDRATTDLLVSSNSSATKVFGVAGGQVRVAANIPFGFSSNNDMNSASLDTTATRISAGLFGMTGIASTGTAAALTGTGACATITTQTGGSWAGSAKCTGTTGASTLTITPGITATNGWVCDVWDETTRANLFQQTSHTPTTCVLTITSVTQNDVFAFKAVAF